MELISILASQWQTLLQPFRVAPKISEQVFLDLVAAYSSPGRYYHTLAHVQLGRQQVLNRFLQRKKIFFTPKMQKTLESRARKNLQIEITSLEL